MTVQDDQRERELCRLFNLTWDPDHERSGTDAHFSVEVDGRRYRIPVEVKSSTKDSVSTARDCGMDHVEKWKRVMWVIGFYSRERSPRLLSMLCLTPADMALWITEIEDRIGPDYLIAEHAAESVRFTLEDLYTICGAKEAYEVADAKRLLKRQWSNEQYRAARDMRIGRALKISPQKMLELLTLRARYIARRGATLNNPHVPKTFLTGFEGTDRVVATNGEPAVRIREIVRSYIGSTRNHPFIEEETGETTL
jgi:hypothetical protein